MPRMIGSLLKSPFCLWEARDTGALWLLAAALVTRIAGASAVTIVDRRIARRLWIVAIANAVVAVAVVAMTIVPMAAAAVAVIAVAIITVTAMAIVAVSPVIVVARVRRGNVSIVIWLYNDRGPACFEGLGVFPSGDDVANDVLQECRGSRQLTAGKPVRHWRKPVL